MNFLKNLVNTAADQLGAGNLHAATGNVSGFGASFNQKPGNETGKDTVYLSYDYILGLGFWVRGNLLH